MRLRRALIHARSACDPRAASGHVKASWRRAIVGRRGTEVQVNRDCFCCRTPLIS